MRTLLVTSAVTFVPENYDQLILGLADEPSVVGLLMLDNRSWQLPMKAFGMIASLASPRLGKTILMNYFGNSISHRQKRYQDLGKKVWILPDINSSAVTDIVREQKIDLIVNCRTRALFKRAVLEAPRLGCINIHHGLLPIQRGLMCDFWAHLEKTKFGFSVHQMTSKIDDGPILQVVENTYPPQNYMESIYQGSILEAQLCRELLREISETGRLPIKERDYNPFREALGGEVVYRKNPKFLDGYRMQCRGVKI